jgi:hypothetical protein
VSEGIRVTKHMPKEAPRHEIRSMSVTVTFGRLTPARKKRDGGYLCVCVGRCASVSRWDAEGHILNIQIAYHPGVQDP